MADLLAVYEEFGKAAIRYVAEHKPLQFVRLVAAIVAKGPAMTNDLEPWNRDELRWAIEMLQEAIRQKAEAEQGSGNG